MRERGGQISIGSARVDSLGPLHFENKMIVSEPIQILDGPLGILATGEAHKGKALSHHKVTTGCTEHWLTGPPWIAG